MVSFTVRPDKGERKWTTPLSDFFYAKGVTFPEKTYL